MFVIYLFGSTVIPFAFKAAYKFRLIASRDMVGLRRVTTNLFEFLDAFGVLSLSLIVLVSFFIGFWRNAGGPQARWSNHPQSIRWTNPKLFRFK
jgi:hypothetical protein